MFDYSGYSGSSLSTAQCTGCPSGRYTEGTGEYVQGGNPCQGTFVPYVCGKGPSKFVSSRELGFLQFWEGGPSKGGSEGGPRGQGDGKKTSHTPKTKYLTQEKTRKPQDAKQANTRPQLQLRHVKVSSFLLENRRFFDFRRGVRGEKGVK
jgi:hypothetical protein